MSLNFLLKFIKRNKFYTAINLIGLSLGIACWWLISVYVGNELNYDRYQQNRQRIYRLTTTIIVQGSPTLAATSSAVTGPRLLKEFPDIEATATFMDAKKVTVKYRDQIFPETGFYKASRDVFKVFSYRLLEGDPATALENSSSIVLTERIAKKYFGNSDPMGRQIYINQHLYQVTGVLQDLPRNSDLYFVGLLSFDPLKADDLSHLDYYTYVLVRSSANDAGGRGAREFVKRFEDRLVSFSDRLYNDELSKTGQDVKLYLHAQPLAGIHFDNRFLVDTPKGEKAYVYVFPLVGLFILLIVCINYTNLSIAQSARRSREIAVKKVVGATIRRLFLQFMQESFFMAFLAALLAAGIATAAIPLFNNITGKEISPAELFDWKTLLVLLAVYLFVGFVSSIYPAIYLSRMNPLGVINSNFTQGGKRNFLRASLTITQFVISNGMIACSMIAFNHLQYLRKTDLGFNTNQLAVVYVPGDSAVASGALAFRNALEGQAYIGSLSFGGVGSLPGGEKFTGSAIVESDTGRRTVVVNHSYVDDRYNHLLNITILKGRDFDKAVRSGSVAPILVNETLAKEVGWKDPIGKRMEANGETSEIIGVIKDFHYTSLHNKLEPLVIHYQSGLPSYIFMRVAPANLGRVAEEWRNNIHQYAFDCRFVDRVFDEEYKKDEKLMTIFGSFCVIAVMLACMGLFGFFSMSAGQRTKEISIRKVLGGGPVGIVYLLSKNFMVNIIFSILLSTPVAWYCMVVWERDFAYHEKITLWIFLFSGALSVLIALTTIIFQAMKATRTNPARALKAE